MLMHDINLLLPPAIRTMRSQLRDVSRQQIPFTVDGLERLGLPGKFASEVRTDAKALGGERLAAAVFISELFAMNHENFASRETLQKWIAGHEGGHGDELRNRIRSVLKAWYEDEFGPGHSETFTFEQSAGVEEKARVFVNRLF